MARLARVVVPGYPHHITQRGNRRQQIWQGRFSSFVMDNKYLLSAVRYVAMNPVKSGLARRPERYRWSSTAAYLSGKDDPLVKVYGLHKMVDDWSEFFRESVDFVVKLEKILDSILRPKKAGRKHKKVLNSN